MTRNLKQYPITCDEIVKRLDEMATEKANDETVGSVDALILKQAATIIERAVFVTYGFTCERK